MSFIFSTLELKNEHLALSRSPVTLILMFDRIQSVSRCPPVEIEFDYPAAVLGGDIKSTLQKVKRKSAD